MFSFRPPIVCAAVWQIIMSAGFATAATTQESAAVSAAQYLEAGPAVRKATLNDLAAHRLSLPANELAEVVTHALKDPSPAVRDGAILGLVMLDYEPGQPANFAVREATLRTLASAYNTETSQKVKVQIVKTFALTSTTSPVREELLLQALRDSEPGVLQFAAMGAGEARLAAALPRLVELLAHTARGVRLNAAQAIAIQGKNSAPYLPQLQAALNIENDEIVRRTIEGAVASLASPRERARN